MFQHNQHILTPRVNLHAFLMGDEKNISIMSNQVIHIESKDQFFHLFNKKGKYPIN